MGASRSLQQRPTSGAPGAVDAFNRYAQAKQSKKRPPTSSNGITMGPGYSNRSFD